MDSAQELIELLLGSDANLKLADPGLVQYYYDLKHRSIWIDDEINDTTLDVVSKIIRWNREDLGISIEERCPIKIFFDSPGGSLDMAQILIQVIEMSETPVIGIGIGNVMSAASMIFISCHKRLALKNVVFLMHRGSCAGMSGDYASLQASMDDYKRQIQLLEEHYLKHTKYTPDELTKNLVTDYYVRGEELVEKGLIDAWVTNISELL